MTSIGEISAAIMTTPRGSLLSLDGGPFWGDFRRCFTTSFTPRLTVLFCAAMMYELAHASTGEIRHSYLSLHP
jgi:hypothetical protein